MYILKIIFSFFKNYKITLIVYFIFTLLTFPLESIVIPQIYSNFFEVLNEKTKLDVFIKYFILILVFLIIINGSIIYTEYIESYLIPELNEYIINYIFKNLLFKYENNIIDIELGKIVSRLNVIPSSMKEFMSDICTWIFPRLLTILAINIYFFYINWRLGCISLLLLLIFVFTCIRNFLKCNSSSYERHILLEEKSQSTIDKLSNSFSIYANSKLNKEIIDYEKNTNKYTTKFKENLSCLNISNIFTTSIVILTFISLNSFSTFLYIKKNISYTNLMTIFIMIIYYTPCLWTINSSMPFLIHNYGILLAVDYFIKELYEADVNKKLEAKNIIINTINNGSIIINNLNFGFNKESYLFKNFYLTIKNNEKVALVGASGNGKSSLIKIIMGYYKIPDNTIFIGNEDLNNFNLNDLRNQISYVNQNNKLFNLSLLENIQYGNDMNRKDIINICKKIKVDNIFKNLKDGLDTNVGVEGNNLSGGQRQLVHILRCIAKKNKIVILDEPTSAIDKDNTIHIINAIKELSLNSTVVLITHDESLLSYVDRIITLDSGKIISDTYITDEEI